MSALCYERDGFVGKNSTILHRGGDETNLPDRAGGAETC